MEKDHPKSFAEDGPPTLGKLSIDINRSNEDNLSSEKETEGVKIKNTFIELEVPRSPIAKGPPTNTAPGALGRLIKARQQPAFESIVTLPEETASAFQSEMGSEVSPASRKASVPEMLPDMPELNTDRALSPPPPGLDIPASMIRRDVSPDPDSEDEPENSHTPAQIPVRPPGDFSHEEANCALQPSPSLGSALHSSGGCNPCAWYWKAGSCSKGYNCSRCHMCPDGELKRRKKTKAKEVASNKKERKASVSSLGNSPFPDRRDGSFAAAAQEPAYVVCGDTHKPVTFDTEFPNGIFHTKVTVGDVPVKNTFIDFKINRGDDEGAKKDGPPTASAPGALLSRLFKTRAKFQAAPPRLASSNLPDNPFGDDFPSTPQHTPMRPPGVLLDAHNIEPPTVPASEESVEVAKPEIDVAAVAAATQGPGHPMYQLHSTKECTPCNYFYYKADGCRQGAECQFCHLCPKGEIKKRKKERVKMLKAQSGEGGAVESSPPIAAS